MRRSVERVVVLAFGLVCGILLVEGGLRVFGALERWAREPLVPVDHAGPVVACLGDSYTWCPGVPRDATYPAQLEVLLNDPPVDPPVRVHNLGRNGQNTTALLEDLPGHLDRLAPDLVLLLTGGANLWDQAGLHAFLEARGEGSGIGGKVERLRTLKLVRLAWRALSGTPDEFVERPARPAPVAAPAAVDRCPSEIRAGHAAARPLADGGQYAGFVAAVEPLVAEDPPCPNLYGDLGVALVELGRYDDALRASTRAAALAPEKAVYRDHLGQIHRVAGRRDEAIAAFLDGLATPDAPGNAFEKDRILQHLGALADVFGPGTRERIEEEMVRREREAPDMAGHLAAFRAQGGMRDATADWIRHDTEQVVAACRARNIPVVLFSYPLRLKGSYGDIPEEVARRNGLRFVDTRHLFEDAPDRATWFLPDNHLNEHGNRRVAEELAPAVRDLLADPARRPGPPGPTAAPSPAP